MTSPYSSLDAGDWPEAIRLIDGRRNDIQDPVPRYPGVELRRLWIVDKPYTPYPQWELYYIRLRAEAGEQIHVLDAGAIRHLGGGAPLSEAVIIGSQVIYEVIYDDKGDLRGARKITDAHVIQAAAHDIHGLFVTANTLQITRPYDWSLGIGAAQRSVIWRVRIPRRQSPGYGRAR
ncbi:DUF6879 family protein [Actinoallomurus sp. NPDC050550]|uniref:DUF6879 family protein n=1 Tax=Actinoallomurus sp. NPDC050550 TaxID=3154937 RepID=UPI0033F49D63